MKTNINTTYGGELEKVIAQSQTGEMQAVSQSYFETLSAIAKERGDEVHFHESDIKPDVKLGTVSTTLGEQGLDNGFNLLETALPYGDSLSDLQKRMQLDLETTQQALASDKVSVINLSNHPLGTTTFADYSKYVAPKGVYSYIWFRGWDHTAGINARAQNSPATSVIPAQAADAVSVIIGAGAAFIGLFANSPYEEGQRADYKESRLMMWDRMMAHSKFQGDRRTARFPEKRFHTMAEYFQWMFGPQTSLHFVLGSGTDYKSIGDKILYVQDMPSVLEFLSKPSWKAYYLNDLLRNFPPQTIEDVKPNIGHMETMQFAQFAGARIRYGLKHDSFPLVEFLEACAQTDKQNVEAIFEKHAMFTYIEGRDPGANFPDVELRNAGKDIAETAMVSPSAIQAGLMANLSEAVAYIDSFDWKTLGLLREEAIKNGLIGKVGDITVADFAEKIVEIAATGLAEDDKKLLDYPEYVLKTGKNGADRAVEFVENATGTMEEKLKALVVSRKVIL
ncbi:MAG: hypothetical protein ACEQSA_02815 [Weeksellaceae bacterium]